MKTCTSLPESSARSTVLRVPFEAPSQNATSTSHASINRWLRAADFLSSASSSNAAGMTCTAMPLARAARVAAASTPLALPVMIDARGGKALTYSLTRSGSENRRLPTMATRMGGLLAGSGGALADGVDVLLEHAAQLERLAIVVGGVRPALAWIQDLLRHVGHGVRNPQPEDGIDVCRHI